MRERAGWYGYPVAVAIAAAALLPTVAVAADPVTFSATGAVQTYTVPPGVTSITATVNGAAGGAFSTGSTQNVLGKQGGQTTATLLVAPGNVLTLVVGKAGSVRGAGTSAAYGGGGAAGGTGGAGGGGGSFVFGPTSTLLLAAGGGGGFGGVFGGGEGAGAGTVGLAGGPGTATGRIGGAPGTETGGGAAGSTGGTAGGGPATIASFATGGAGGGASGGGGGGGGGYFGGGGGGSPDGLGGGGGGQGGGGGSGYASPNAAFVTGASGSVGTQAGDGQITFVPNEGLVPPPPPVAEQCANGVDDDHDGFTDAADPQCKLNRGSEGPVDNPLIACTDNDLVLVNVVRAGGRVLVSGIADRGFQGRTVEIFAGDTKAGDAVVADNGVFAASLPAPSARKARTIRYQARLDQRRSRALKLARHMSVTTAQVSGAAVVLAGRVTGSRRRHAVVELLGRTGGCNSHKFVVVGRARLRSDGSFRVTAKPFPDLAIAIYRARTTVPGGRTFTLPQAVKLR